MENNNVTSVQIDTGWRVGTQSVNTFLSGTVRDTSVRSYQAAGSTCGISPSCLLDSRTAAGDASHTQTRHRPAERIRDEDLRFKHPWLWIRLRKWSLGQKNLKDIANRGESISHCCADVLQDVSVRCDITGGCGYRCNKQTCTTFQPGV